MGSLASGQFSVRQMEEKRFKSVHDPYSEPSLKQKLVKGRIRQRHRKYHKKKRKRGGISASAEDETV